MYTIQANEFPMLTFSLNTHPLANSPKPFYTPVSLPIGKLHLSNPKPPYHCSIEFRS